MKRVAELENFLLTHETFKERYMREHPDLFANRIMTPGERAYWNQFDELKTRQNTVITQMIAREENAHHHIVEDALWIVGSVGLIVGACYWGGLINFNAESELIPHLESLFQSCTPFFVNGLQNLRNFRN